MIAYFGSAVESFLVAQEDAIGNVLATSPALSPAAAAQELTSLSMASLCVSRFFADYDITSLNDCGPIRRNSSKRNPDVYLPGISKEAFERPHAVLHVFPGSTPDVNWC